MASQDSDSSVHPSKSGITTDEHGIRHIPSSVRADGSVRKEIKIRPGYRPPEDVEVYRNRTAESWKKRGSGGVPGAEAMESQDAADAKDAGSSSNKSAKRREARRKAAAAAKAEAGGEVVKQEGGEKEEELDPLVEREKQAKKLAKKLRQARELKDKKDSGAALLPEQFEKVIRIKELIRQLDALGFDSNGEKKDGEAT